MPPPRDLDFWPFDLEVGVGVACDLGYPCAKFRLGLLVFELEPMYATSDGQTVKWVGQLDFDPSGHAGLWAS